MRRLALLLIVVAGLTMGARGAIPCEMLRDQPSCLVTFLPGPTRDTFDLIEISGADSTDSEGQLLLTTVLVDDSLSFREWIESHFDDGVDAYDRELIYPPGIDDEEVDRQNAFLMQDSQLDATLAALRAVGFEVSSEPIGLSVAELVEGNNIQEGDLEPGDLLVAVEGEPVVTIDDILAVLRGFEPGDDVTVTRQRGVQEPVSVEIELVESPDEPGRPLIGILLTPEYDLPVDVDIDAGSIGGPSAGLMFALSIVDLLMPEDLTAGAVIAGTGTISDEGTVGSIGGIRQKILGALDRGDDPPATVFLVPENNFDEARGAPVDDMILLVPVGTLHEAIEALQVLRDGGTPTRAVAIGG